jgi:hypothetical protein
MEALKKQNKALEKQKKVGWAKYFASEKENLKQSKIYKAQLDIIKESMVDNIPEHIKHEFNEMYKSLKITTECPICLEELDTFELSNCGHKYCKECLDKLIETSNKCCLCRKQLKWKPK